MKSIVRCIVLKDISFFSGLFNWNACKEPKVFAEHIFFTFTSLLNNVFLTLSETIDTKKAFSVEEIQNINLPLRRLGQLHIGKDVPLEHFLFQNKLYWIMEFQWPIEIFELNILLSAGIQMKASWTVIYMASAKTIQWRESHYFPTQLL